MQQYQQIRTFLATGNELELFEADLRPIDDLILEQSHNAETFNENQTCLGLDIIDEIATLLEKREHTRAVVRRIVRDNGIFEDAALQLNATIKLISEKFAALDSWVLTEHDRLLDCNLESSEKQSWVAKPQKAALR